MLFLVILTGAKSRKCNTMTGNNILKTSFYATRAKYKKSEVYPQDSYKNNSTKILFEVNGLQMLSAFHFILILHFHPIVQYI